jgi:dienelactone hydrolase
LLILPFHQQPEESLKHSGREPEDLNPCSAEKTKPSKLGATTKRERDNKDDKIFFIQEPVMKTIFILLNLLLISIASAQTTPQQQPDWVDTLNQPNPEDYVHYNTALKENYVNYVAPDGTKLIGFFVYDDKYTGKLPAVVVVHEWWGLNDYARMRARRLAELGYAAFAADIYGNGFETDNPDSAGMMAGKFRNDRKLMRERINAAVDVVEQHPQCDPERVAVMGYCFGGTVSLELARSGRDVDGVISFHGNLDTPNPADAKNIKCKVLVLHGADDPYVPKEQVEAFVKEMNDAGVDWKMQTYQNAVHGFTNPNNSRDNSTGLAYNELADRRSMEAMKTFLADVLKKEE